jgi:4'-phosphopantetheinyl transferase
VDQAPVTVLPWPAELSPDTGLCVISVATPPGTDRTVGRRRIRAALREALGALLGRPARSLELHATAGSRLRVEGLNVGLSVSHDDGLSLGAIHLHRQVGIDLMRVPSAADFYPDWRVLARDYLGPQVSLLLEKTTAAARPQAFAEEWCAQEARLKCAGSPLTEWEAARHCQLAACELRPLRLPPGLVGRIACGAPIK